MRKLALLLLAACGPMPTLPDASEDAGYDAGAADASVRVTLTWQTPSCMACQASADVAASDVAGFRNGLSSSLNGWMCALSESDAGVSADCTYRCGRPPGTSDAGCAFVPCVGGPLMCR